MFADDFVLILSSANGDYIAVMRVLSFNSTILSITTPVTIREDTIDENTENFGADLSLLRGNPSRVTINPSAADVSIIDNDSKFINHRYGCLTVA